MQAGARRSKGKTRTPLSLFACRTGIFDLARDNFAGLSFARCNRKGSVSAFNQGSWRTARRACSKN
jgi:hypothetical protein